VRPGETLIVDGAALQSLRGVEVARSDVSRPLTWVNVEPARATVRVPGDLASGTWTLRALSSRGESVGDGLTFEVWSPMSEPPCTKRYALRVSTELLGRKLHIDHVFADGTEEHHTLVGTQLEGVTLSSAPGCGALWVLTRDARRWLVADSVEGDAGLLPQAQALAAALDIPLAREDLAGGATPGTNPGAGP
jgi:hypothetical protein